MTDHLPPRFDRRAFLALIAAAGGAACTPRLGSSTAEAPSTAPGTASPAPSARPSPSAVPSPSPSPSPSPTSRRTPFEPIAGDAYPNAKRAAGRFVEALTTYPADRKPHEVLRTAARGRSDRDFDVDGALRRAGPLLVRGAVSRGNIVYPQLGGLTLEPGNERASVMVVVRQHLRDKKANSRTLTRTVDVRLVIREDRWRVEDLADGGGEPVEAPKKVPEPARRVLDDARIQLPDSARWDILAGIIDERLLDTMAALAEIAPYAVTTLKTGHPTHVFGTDVVSGHTLGRGVDIWRIAGQPVVLQQPSLRSAAHAFTVSALRDLEVPELGSPWDLDGPPEPGELKPSFTDAVHADHIHIAFKAA